MVQLHQTVFNVLLASTVLTQRPLPSTATLGATAALQEESHRAAALPALWVESVLLGR